MSKKLFQQILLVLLLVAVFLFGMNVQQILIGPQGQQTVQRVVEQKVYVENSALTKAVDRVLPSIVLVFAGSEAEVQTYLVGNDLPNTRQGLLLTQDGLIATLPFPKAVDKIWVFASDGKYYPAEKVLDGNLLYLKANLPGNVVDVPELASTSSLVAGQKVLTVSGFPFNNQIRVQDSIINNIKKGVGIIGLIKADLINEFYFEMTPSLGESWDGSTVVNLDGQVIGLKLGNGIFPVDQITQQLKLFREKTQMPTQKWGFGFVMLNEKMAKLLAFNASSKVFSQTVGAYIWPTEDNGIEANSFAALIGLKQGDLILEIDGKTVKTLADMQERLTRKRVGEKMKFKVARILPTLSKAGEPEILDMEEVIK